MTTHEAIYEAAADNYGIAGSAQESDINTSGKRLSLLGSTYK